MMGEEVEKRTSGQKQVFGFEGGCERKGQQRLDKIRAASRLGRCKHQKLGSGCCTAQGASTEIAGPARRDRAGA